MLATLLEIQIVVSVLCDLGAAGHQPFAKTPFGWLMGHWMTSRSGRRFQAYSGVPYAQPPVGDLTFQPPAPLTPWTGVKNATENGPYCIQYDLWEVPAEVKGQEDCLYLSVYTHNLREKAAVLVHFHSGGFISGNGADKTGPQYLMDEDVVIVDVNYRVGIYGFLSFEDKDFPGNQGMKDQVMSLKWVQQSIFSFGGDPNRVTLVGESAGGISTYYHTVSPLSKGLFHGGIVESGVSYSPRCLAPKGFVRNRTMELSKSLGCSYSRTIEMVECIKEKDPKKVVSKLEIFRIWQVDPLYNFIPVFEEAVPGAFLVGPTSSWEHAEVPLLIGMTSAEGYQRTKYFPIYNMSYKWYSDNFETIAPISLSYFTSASNPDKVTAEVRKYYFPNHEITENDWVNITTMYSDSWLTYSTIMGVNNHPGNVYFYYFDYLGNKSLAGDASTRNDSIVFAAPHTEEIIYIWWMEYFQGMSGKDLELSKKLVKVWTDFAKYGTPAPKGSGLNWKRWTPERHRYIHISKKGFNLKEGFAEDRYKFWESTNFMDKLIF